MSASGHRTPGTGHPPVRADFAAWLRSREPAPPPDLAAKLAECLAAAPDDLLRGASRAEAAGRLGLARLRTAVARRDVSEEAAMDLLAADALVTYAFEAAAEEGADLTALVRRLLAEVGT
ncbi:MAG TPA: hypothetical protein VMT77_07335 [Gemmatimonadales bacterium]|nr:hypothetical protein [Gemmatimonadales bacterium]